MPINPIDLDATLKELERLASGKLSFAFYDLQTGALTHHRGDEKTAAASTIKLAILIHIALTINAGSEVWSTQLTLTDAIKSPGAGVLRKMSAGTKLTIRDLAYLMTTISDNTATNLLLDHFGIEAINTRIHNWGLSNTRIQRKLYAYDTPATRQYGFGVSTPNEMAQMLKRVVERQLGSDKTVNEKAANEVLAILAEQQDRSGIPRYLPDLWSYAGKTGAVDNLRADVGLVTTPAGERYILACFCSDLKRINWTVDNPGWLAIGRLAERLLRREQTGIMRSVG